MSDETLPPYVHAEQPVFYNVGAWLKENEESFQPPVCNKMMHNYQLKVALEICLVDNITSPRVVQTYLFTVTPATVTQYKAIWLQ